MKDLTIAALNLALAHRPDAFQLSGIALLLDGHEVPGDVITELDFQTLESMLSGVAQKSISMRRALRQRSNAD